MTYQKFSEILDLLDHGRFTADQLIQLGKSVEASYRKYYCREEEEECNGKVQ